MSTGNGKSAALDSAMRAALGPPFTEGGGATLQQLLDGMPDPVFFKDLHHRWTACNQAFCNLFSRSREELLGLSDLDFVAPEIANVFLEHDDLVIASRKAEVNEELFTPINGELRVVWTRKTPVFDASGAVVGVAGIMMDVTDHKEHLRKTAALEAEAVRQRAIIAAQEHIINELVVPVLEVWQGILLLPLVGTINAARASHAVDSTLKAVSQRGTSTVILDVTGVGTLSTEVAELLVSAVRAIALLGCQSIVVGISPASARILVAGGADLRAMTTCGTLQEGLERALARRR